MIDEVVVVGHAQSVDELLLVAEVSRWTKALSVRAARRCCRRLEGENVASGDRRKLDFVCVCSASVDKSASEWLID